MFSLAAGKRLRSVHLLALMLAAVLCTDSALAQARSAFPLAPLRGTVKAAGSDDSADLTRVLWRDEAPPIRLSEIGRGKGVIFSPDLSVPTNRRFYERLGFAYFEDASWATIVSQIQTRNRLRPADRIEVLIIETHGTNGNGLKVQDSHDPRARRSYISVGALQENLQGSGVRLCVVTACNAGRLLRPRIYHAIDRSTRDPLFLPATLGILNASPRFNSSKSAVRIAYPAKSALETVNYGNTSEFAPTARELLGLDTDGATRASTKGGQGIGFVVSDILVQMLTRDRRLALKSGGYVGRLSKANFTNQESEDLYLRFLSFVNSVAASEAAGLRDAGRSSSAVKTR